MPEKSEERIALRYQGAELAVAGLFLLLGALVVFDSVRLGARWGEDGPQPGYFPFYLGVIICIASGINFLRGLLVPAEKNWPFVEVGQLKLVLSVLIPSIVFAALIEWLGIYVAAILYVGFFMRWLGGYAWWKLVTVSLGNSVFFYLTFEIWFKVPLPKGPLEALLGLD